MKVINVAIGLVLHDDKVLVALRQQNQHQGGLWEYPGGKVELNETFDEALIRELAEEVDVHATAAELFWQTQHDYGDRIINLKAFKVIKWHGTAVSKEGNQTQWVALDQLMALPMPAANQPLNLQLASA
ncbi:(deoxy)nucleoside triphosphate pyrophosphohydrolase [Ferrimonas lipolytica]|uniref:8-oxo-dGTP diphosphatase n=1 Tax=Ferrimonas lipolytica TaxID=2724191 RepID=A0A6H1UL66_9GAMM|nr:(deoxy)nucleoside triphosphate pyrophosphohydrolase [Ferrimonas lipolytica]QIZ78542.1 (deoxy)nucleoside triphosphate pyrophosphohydrolase [Ferrimonas lipolytica]